MGRERAANVIDVKNNKEDIEAGITKALYDDKFRSYVKNIINPYGVGDSAGQIVKILKEVSFKGKIQKIFYEGS